jgi:hypothetical protein
MAHPFNNIARRSRVTAAALLGAGALSLGAAPAASAGGTDALLRAVVPGSVVEAAKPITDAVAPVTDPVADAATPVTAPVVAAAKPATEPVKQALDQPLTAATEPVAQITEQVTTSVAERVVRPVAGEAAPVATIASKHVVEPVAKHVASATKPVVERVARPVAHAAAPVVETATRAVSPRRDAVASTVDDLENGLASRQRVSVPTVSGAAAPASTPSTAPTPAPRSAASTDLRGGAGPAFAAIDLDRDRPAAIAQGERTTPLAAPLAPSIDVASGRSRADVDAANEQRDGATTSVERRLPTAPDRTPVAPTAGLSGGSTASAGNGPLTGGMLAMLPESVEPVATTGLPTTFTPVAGWTPVTLVGEVHRPD